MEAAQAPHAYHERQRLHRCLQHALNNLYQTAEFSTTELDGIADALAPGRLPLPLLGHPHRTLLLGNYDVNVLEVALRRRGMELHWHDQRDVTFERLDLSGAGGSALLGLVLNVRGEGLVSRVTGGRHWLALRRLGGRWYNLDSQLPAPRLVADCCCCDEDPAAAAAAGGPSGTPAAGTAQAAAGAAEECAAEAADAGSSASTAASAAVAAARQPAEDAGAVTAAAADAAALRRFLVQQAQQRDAKVFVVLPCSLASHPLAPEEGCVVASEDS